MHPPLAHIPVPVGGLLLTGGASRRMGRDKALLEIRGQRLVDRAAERLSLSAGPVLEVGPGWSTLPAVREEPPGAGPLAALSAGANALRALGHAGPVLLLAVDMPNVSVGFLRYLASKPVSLSVVPRVDGVPQPLCARFSPDVLAGIDELLAQGARSLRALLESIGDRNVSWVEPDEWTQLAGPDELADVDTPADLRRLFGQEPIR